MMKRLFTGLLVTAFFVSGVSTARVEFGEDEADESEQAFDREAQREERKRNKEEKRRDCEKNKCKTKKPKVCKNEEKARQCQLKKEEKRCKKEQKCKEREWCRSEEGRHHRAMERQDAREQHKMDRAARQEERRDKRAASKVAKKQRNEQEREERISFAERTEHQERLKVEQNKHNVRMARSEREHLMETWCARHEAEKEQMVCDGKYADLYKSPAWPIWATAYQAKDLLDVTFDYQYATDCYDSNRSGSKSNITRLAFGENPITIDSILLATKLFNTGKMDINNFGAIQSISVESDQVLFRGKKESYALNIALSRYLFRDTIAAGVEIPVVYKHNKLRTITLFPFQKANFDPNALDIDDITYQRTINRILLAKGITEMGGSATGLGDVSFFVNGQIDSVYFDKLFFGARFVFPTGKKAPSTKLWAPDLGNGGFTQIMPFTSILFSYNRYFNPHALADVTFTLPAHVDRRIPRVINIPQITGNVGPNAAFISVQDALNGDAPFAYADRVGVVGVNPGPARVVGPVTDYDTTVRGFGDTVTSVKMHQGTNIHFRIGNIMERVFVHRGFFETFYDFRYKTKDRASGIQTDQYNVDILREHTNQLEHRIGFDYSYQQDLYVRIRMGLIYTFAGMNVPKTFEAKATFNYAF